MATSSARLHADPDDSRVGSSPGTRRSRSAVLYTRVSSKEQEEHGFSLPAQRELLEAYAKDHGLQVAKHFEESETAKTGGKRPAFGRMVEFLRERSGRVVLLVEKTDRLYRNLKDWITLDDLKIEIHFVKEGSVISPDSHSSQKFLHGIKVLMAKNYVENLSEEIRKGMSRKAKEGAFPSVAPIGYLNTPDKKVGIVPDPKYSSLVRHLFEKAATGLYSTRELTKLARTLGLRSKKGAVLNKNTLCSNVLRNPAYYGTFRWGGKLYEGKYEPLLSKAVFDQVQKNLAARKIAKGTKKSFTYSGLLLCGHCGGLMSGDLKKGKYVYYACAGTKKCRRYYSEKMLEEETLKILGSIQINQAVADWILGELEKLHDGDFDEAALAKLTSRRRELQRLRSQAYEEKLLGKIDEGFWKERDSAWQRQVEEIDADLKSLENAVSKEEMLAAARKPIELLQVAPDLYLSQEPAEKARLLKTLVSNYTLTDGTLAVSMRSPFDVLARGSKTKEWWS